MQIEMMRMDGISSVIDDASPFRYELPTEQTINFFFIPIQRIFKKKKIKFPVNTQVGMSSVSLEKSLLLSATKA